MAFTRFTRFTGNPHTVYTYVNSSHMPVNLVKGVKIAQKSSYNPLTLTFFGESSVNFNSKINLNRRIIFKRF